VNPILWMSRLFLPSLTLATLMMQWYPAARSVPKIGGNDFSL